ncbi:uncharacterized protein [Primulina huaijiensis]|uniref:uncharacterized protein n=1 Tax=Primulina huaijiensis TaxID=1492673 RepID=UPI003CC78453
MRDCDKVRCTTYMLRDDASQWWEGAAHGVNLATLISEQFKEVFYGKYFLADVKGRLTREFMSLRKGDSTVAEFIRKFDRGCYFVPLIARDVAQKLRHFMDGLRPTLRRDVMLMRPVSYDKATACAFHAEQGQQKPQGQFMRPIQQRPPHAQGDPKLMEGQLSSSATDYITGNACEAPSDASYAKRRAPRPLIAPGTRDLRMAGPM